jgi:hypothetical protein
LGRIGGGTIRRDGLSSNAKRPARCDRGEPPLLHNRGDRRCTFPDDITGQGLLRLGLTERIDFQADAFFCPAQERD